MSIIFLFSLNFQFNDLCLHACFTNARVMMLELCLQTLHALHKTEKALLLLNSAIATNPRNPMCKFNRARILFASERSVMSGRSVYLSYLGPVRVIEMTIDAPCVLSIKFM